MAKLSLISKIVPLQGKTMANMKNAKWVVKSHPEADLSEDNFELVYDEMPEPRAGQVLIKTKTLVITPPLRMAVGSGGITGALYSLGI